MYQFLLYYYANSMRGIYVIADMIKDINKNVLIYI